MNRIYATIFTASLTLSALPAHVWADCHHEPPLFSTVSTQDVRDVGTTFAVVARDKFWGCPTGKVTLTAVGAPVTPTLTPGPGEAALTFKVPAIFTPGIYHITYTATDELNNTTSVTLPLRTGYSNSTPILSPVSDIVAPVYKLTGFSVALTDRDGDLPITEDALRIDGLPEGTRKVLLRLSSSEIVYQVTLYPSSGQRGAVYQVLIKGKDSRGGIVISQMRVLVL
ncbi:MAG TPA: hypothetical protein DDX89_05405 [Candidatus Omnitrophica bacterium]|nr:MAG: hypothetical protein A2Z92_05140 [Omnitrophica WOR_2 bacterium GWA2_63_20]OGX16831.1 MAG: hypothetical protein A2105_02520 [Omnitrophica WOR_2 bacterium GWF2_63_9]OGX32141.1 MAG: hypothetical protein A3E56_04725 [Omnitrophica WOR_2 bacterium RIFCSPHIGHO2_12_FULL_64_13]OGX35134.1 MAG: hypothetical protein A3B73_02140 [Omnitrophica WOR_2 bacterium RIFCSPHIGHO2_02_FULL_63_39]OGX45582.1 MAG: hypothetical protein A3I71_01875 [Omnitrophica WOR_2 bacterium RIFCSPLOWO2_02_FULL_63_16]OGX48464.1